MFTIFQKQNKVNAVYDFPPESGNVSEQGRDANFKKEQQETSKFILNNDNNSNPNFSEGQKTDIKKIQEMYKNGGLSDMLAVDKLIKLLWEGKSLEQQDAPMNKISDDFERARQARNASISERGRDQASANEMIAMAFGEKPPKPEQPQPTTRPGEYPSMPTYSTSPIEPTPVSPSPSPTPVPGNSNF